MTDLIGQQLGNYRLIRLLGQGGFAEVYLGEHLYLGTNAAIKVLYTQLRQDDIGQFRAEARLIARLEHPHIVRILDFGVDGAIPYLVMSYAPRGTLRQSHPKGTRLPLSTVISYIQQIAPALHYAHEQRLIHRDIKPENLLVGLNNEILLSDFGIALVAQSSRYQSTSDMAGTISYMAPEQIEAHPRPASDQYSLGIVVYEWLCGERPFQGSFTEIAVKQSLVPPPPLRERVPALSADVEHVVLTALAKDYKQRFASVQAFATALEQTSQSMHKSPSFPSPAVPPARLPPIAPPLSSYQPVPSAPSNEAFISTEQTAMPAQPTSTQVTPTPVNQPLLIPENLRTPSSPIPNPAASAQPTEMPARRVSRRTALIGIALTGLATVGGTASWYTLTHPSTLGTAPASGNNPAIPISTVPLVIKIGCDFPVSRNDESFGKPAENGAHLAVDQANQQKLVPHVTFVFVPKDDVGPSGVHDPAIGQKNVVDFIGDALVAGVVGPLNSSVAQAELPVTNQAAFPIISPANTNDCLTQTEPAFECGGTNSKIAIYRPTGKVTYFRIATRDQFQGVALADFAYKTKGWKSAYVIDDTETYGVDIANAFETQWRLDGGTVIGHQSAAPTITSYLNLLTQMAALHPDVIFFGGVDSTGGILIRQQMKQVPALRNTPLLGGDGIQTSAMATTIGAYKADGSNGSPVFSSVASVNINALPSAQKFLSDYAKAYGANNIGAYSAGSYDCAMVIIQAIKEVLTSGVKAPVNSADVAQGKVFRQAVITAIQKISYDGVTGHIGFDQNGDTTNKTILIYTIADNVNVGDGWTFLKQVSVS